VEVSWPYESEVAEQNKLYNKKLHIFQHD
jgi:hypothetical protein